MNCMHMTQKTDFHSTPPLHKTRPLQACHRRRSSTGLRAWLLLVPLSLLLPLHAAAQQTPAELEVFTDREAVPEGSAANIVVRAESFGSAERITVTFQRQGPGRDRTELSSPSVMLIRGRTTEQRISVFVRQDSETQRSSGAFSIRLTADPGNAGISPSSLSFIIPPSGLSVELTEIHLEKAEGSPERISTVHATFAVAGGLQGGKSFAVSPMDDRLIVQDGIIAADQDSFSVTMGLEKDAVLNEGETLDLIRIHHLDALRPSARMSAQISASRAHTCAIRTNNRIRCWGGDTDSSGSHEAASNDSGAFLAVSNGRRQVCALRINNAPVCWGSINFSNNDGNNFLAINSGSYHVCALTTDNKVECRGSNTDPVLGTPTGQASVPASLADETFVAVSAGDAHTCALTTGDKVKCWGSNTDFRAPGQMTNQATVPASLADETFVAVSAGGAHSCVIGTDKKARCWGNNAHGRAPAEREGAFLAVSAGGFHTCGIKISGRLECWGSNTNNRVSAPNADTSTFIAVSAGNSNTCAVTAAGEPRCWGNNNNGRSTPPEGLRARISPDTPWLFEKSDDAEGIALYTSYEPPSPEISAGWDIMPEGESVPVLIQTASDAATPIAVLLSSDGPAELSAAALSLDGGVGVVFLSVPDDEEPQTVGRSFSAELRSLHQPGFRKTLNYMVPPNDLSASLTALSALYADGEESTTFTVISMEGTVTVQDLSGEKSLAVSSDNENFIVQSGIIDHDRGSFMFAVKSTPEEGVDLTQRDTKNLTFGISYLDALRTGAMDRETAEISAGGFHSCMIRTGNALRCWGRNTDGSVVGPNRDAGTFLNVSAGHEHTCALTMENKVRCWGKNDHGQAPAQPAGRFLAVSAGRSHTCAVRADGRAACWGSNLDPSDSTVQADQAMPPENEAFLALSAGDAHTCGIRIDGRIRCWGLGDEKGEDSEQALVPDALRQRTFTAVSTGGRHTCALAEDGGAECWGSNANNNQASAPQGRFLALSAGDAHTCAAAMAGTVQCWGENTDGKAPARRSGSFIAISAGGGHTCAVSEDGRPECWGSNQDNSDPRQTVNQAMPPEGMQARLSPDALRLSEEGAAERLSPNLGAGGIAFDRSAVRLRIRVYLEGALR